MRVMLGFGFYIKPFGKKFEILDKPTADSVELEHIYANVLLRTLKEMTIERKIEMPKKATKRDYINALFDKGTLKAHKEKEIQELQSQMNGKYHAEGRDELLKILGRIKELRREADALT